MFASLRVVPVRMVHLRSGGRDGEEEQEDIASNQESTFQTATREKEEDRKVHLHHSPSYSITHASD